MKIILLMLLLFSYGQSSLASECVDVLSLQGIGKGQADVYKHCQDHFMSSAPSKSILKTEKIEIVGAHNAIFIKNLSTNTNYIISGPLTTLSNVKAIAVDDSKKEVFAINSDHIVVFPFIFGGNLTPFRVLKNNMIKKAEDIEIHNGELFVLVPSVNKIFVYNKNVNSSVRKKLRKDDLLRSIEGIPTETVSFKIENNVLKLYDKNDAFISEINTLN